MRRGCHIALIIAIAIIFIFSTPVIVVFVIVSILLASVTFAVSIFIHILPGAIVYASLLPIAVPLKSIRIIPVKIVVAAATATLCPPTLFAFPPLHGAAHGLSIDPTRMRWRLVVVLSSVCSWMIQLLLPRLTIEA